VQVIHKGFGDFKLADGPEHGINKRVGPSADMRNGARVNLQVDQLLRSNAVSVKNRNNLAGRISFSVSMECATVEAATFQSFAFPINIPRRGDIWFVEGAITIKLINAGI